MRALRATVPAIVLDRPKFAHNVGAVVRLASCYGYPSVLWTGDRVTLDVPAGQRLPREERMKAYHDVSMFATSRPFDMLPTNCTPVCVELVPTAQQLHQFEHPENPVYVFGPEDGSVSGMMRRHCHSMVAIPAAHCLNLGTAVATVLYARRAQRLLAGDDPPFSTADMLDEHRGPLHGPVGDIADRAGRWQGSDPGGRVTA
jgi:tRNA(Leu) C34 or U34 (ribose-2'-O)-methylase TrmL